MRCTLAFFIAYFAVADARRAPPPIIAPPMLRAEPALMLLRYAMRCYARWHI